MIAKLLTPILEMFYGWTDSWAFAIILLTIFVKMILYPLSFKQMKSIEDQKKLQPKFKELQEKYKNKPEEYQKRMMELYKENKVNPFGSCLLMIIQIPIMFGLFSVLRTHPMEGATFFWIENLKERDPFYILPILSAATSYVQMKQTSTNDQTQSTMLTMMPLIFGVMSISLSAGLVLYWTVSNIVSIIQQYFILRSIRGAKGADN